MDTFINILFADDEIEEHIFFKEAINKINVVGHNVMSVYDGVQVLDYLLKEGPYKNSKDPVPDLLILDLNMPLMDGFGVIKKLKSLVQFKNLPLYVLTTSGNTDQLTICKNLGCSGYFAKPVKNDKLTKIIESILEKEATRI